MFTFAPGAEIFAMAGLIAAAGPVLIHLLNRRRFKVIDWAAMDFLLEAARRSRRILQLRDLLLLLLRTAALALFGLALARPLWSHSGSVADDTQPVHAVLAVDNSLSMGYEKFDHPLIDEAKSKAKEFIEALPEGSRVTVLPLAGSTTAVSLDAFRTKRDAREALDRIRPVDRSVSAVEAIDAGLAARARLPEFKDATRLVFIGDQQAIDWPTNLAGFKAEDAPEIQVVSIAPAEPDNTWIESFAIEDGLADVETPVVLKAVVRHEGPVRNHVQVTLTVDGVETASETIDLEPHQSREVAFRHHFELAVEPGKPVYVPAKVSIPADRLPADDERFLAVPVVAALPVVFIDQYGADEDPKRNRYGETRHLRRLLAPVTSRGDDARQLVRVKHVRIDKVDQSLLEDARLAIVAGVANPEGSVPALGDFVRQGGQLVIAAGADFDPVAWNQAAWLEGAGILPAPLEPRLFGKTPEEAPAQAKPFQLAFESLTHDYFQLADVPEDDLKSLYGEPLFFKAAEIDVGDAATASLIDAETKRIEERQEFLAAADARAKRWADLEAKGALSDAQRREREADEQARAALEPRWLIWPEEQFDAHAREPARKQAERTAPRVLAAFDNHLPYLVERQIGRGSVLFVASGMFSPWTTLPKTNAMLMFDRLLRGMLQRTLPNRNLATGERIVLPIAERGADYSLLRPDGAEQSLAVDALGADAYGVTIRNAFQRGVYKITATKADASADPARPAAKLLEIDLAINGPARESAPEVLDEAGLAQRVGDSLHYRWVGRGDAISVAGAHVSGQNLWKWLLGAVMLALLLELAVLARPMLSRGRAA